MKTKKEELLDLFRDEKNCRINDELVWKILMMSGVCKSGAYSMYFWCGF